jgi:N-acetylmuramoyl-L-alanine amidase
MNGIHASALACWSVGQTVWGEARGEDILGQIAVAWVIRNRHDYHPRWRAHGLYTICTAQNQFACWNLDDVNRKPMLAIGLDDAVFAECLQVAVEVIAGLGVSPVGHATHYYAPSSRMPMPSWAVGHTPYVQIGHHLFFEGIA